MKLLLAALCLSGAASLVGAGPSGPREGGRNGPILSMFGQLIQSMQQHKSDPLLLRLKGFVEKAGRDPAETKDEMLEILGELKEELIERRSALEATAGDEVDEAEVPQHRKHPSTESGDESHEDELGTVKKIQKKVNRAIRLLEGLDPQLVGKLVESVKPSIEKLLMESERDDEEPEGSGNNPKAAEQENGDPAGKGQSKTGVKADKVREGNAANAGKVQEKNKENTSKVQEKNRHTAGKVQETNGVNAREVQKEKKDATVEN